MFKKKDGAAKPEGEAKAKGKPGKLFGILAMVFGVISALATIVLFMGIHDFHIGGLYKTMKGLALPMLGTMVVTSAIAAFLRGKVISAERISFEAENAALKEEIEVRVQSVEGKLDQYLGAEHERIVAENEELSKRFEELEQQEAEARKNEEERIRQELEELRHINSELKQQLNSSAPAAPTAVTSEETDAEPEASAPATAAIG